VPSNVTARRAGRGARLAATALAVALVAACSSPSGPRDERAPAGPTSGASASGGEDLAWKACGGGFECAVLDVTLVEDEPARGTVPLALTRLPAADRVNRVGSIVVNPGGPGLSAVDHLQAAWTSTLPVVRERFDLVAFDPRAVGRSSPLRCASTAELDRYFALDPTPDGPEELTALAQGAGALATACARGAGRLLGHLSTAAAVGDLEAVRVAVGDERLTYLGYSYGTTIGAGYLDRFPDRVRAMVLDSPIPASLTWDEVLTGQAVGFERALAAFLADCERTPAPCAARSAATSDAAYDRRLASVEDAPLPGDGTRNLSSPGEAFLA
jgi:pimeloyl-ACP methyl ester carboxylesterase